MLTFKEVLEEGHELKTFRELISEYQQFLDVDLCFQKFDEELKNPLEKYAPPRGIVLVAYWNDTVCACGALQDLGDGVCEIKRIYVRPVSFQVKFNQTLNSSNLPESHNKSVFNYS